MKMKRNWSQRRFAVPGAQERARKEFLARGQDVGNGGLYEKPVGYGTANGVLREREQLVKGNEVLENGESV